MNNAASLWCGTADQAVALLRAELSYIYASRAARLVGSSVDRNDLHAKTLRRVPGEYGMQLGILLAAAPATKRARIAEEFSKVLDIWTATEMRGMAAGTTYQILVWVDGVCTEYQIRADADGAQLVADQMVQDALTSGAGDAATRVWLMCDAA